MTLLAATFLMASVFLRNLALRRALGIQILAVSMVRGILGIVPVPQLMATPSVRSMLERDLLGEERNVVLRRREQ